MKDKAEILSGFPYNYAVSVEIGIIYSVNRDNNSYIVKGMESGAIYRNVRLLLPVNSYQGVQSIATPHHKDTCLLLIRKNNMEKQVWILGFMKLGDDTRNKEIYLGDQGWYLSEDMYVILHENGLFEIRYGNGMLIYDSQTGYRKNIVINDKTVLDKLNFRHWYKNKDGIVGFTEEMHKTMEPLETSQKDKPNYSRTFGGDCPDALMKDVIIAFNYNKDVKFTHKKSYDGDDGWYISESITGEGFHSSSRIKEDSYERELVFGDIGYTVVVKKGEGIHITDKNGNKIDMDGDGAVDYKSTFGTEISAKKNGDVIVTAGKDIEVNANKATVNANTVKVTAKTESDVTAPKISLSGAVTVAGSVSVASSSGALPMLSLDKSGTTIGEGASHPVPLGDVLMAWLATHTHISSAPGSPTGPPLPTPSIPSMLSKATKVK